MPIKYTKNNWLKQSYEEYLGQVISIATWYRVKAALKDNDLPISPDSLKLAASLKTIFKDSKLPLADLLNGYLKTSNLKANQTYKGTDVFRELKQITGVRCSDVTIIRWFRDIKQDARGFRFSRERQYSATELHPIYLRAYAYKNKYGSHKYQFSAKTINIKTA